MGIFQNSGFNGFLCSVRKTLQGYTEHFMSGFTGWGWKLSKNDKTGRYKFEIDDLFVRGTMTVFELILSKIRAIKGALTISQGGEKVERVTELNTQYMLEIEADTNSIMKDDFIRCEVFASGNKRSYHVLVDGIDGKKIFINKEEFEGYSLPLAGDEIVQFGNKTDKNRQSCIYLHADENSAPAIDVMFDVDSKNWVNKTKIRLGGELPGGSGAKGLYCENGMLLCVDIKGGVIYKLSPDGSLNIGKGALVYNPVADKMTFGSNVVIEWSSLSDETKQNLKGKDGTDANLLDWIQEWNGNRTEIGGKYIISPRLFSGTKNSSGTLTGVAIGRGVIVIDGVERTGVFGLNEGKITFELDSITGAVKADGAHFIDCYAENFQINNGTIKNITADNIKVKSGEIGDLKIEKGSLVGYDNSDERIRVSIDSLPNFDSFFSYVPLENYIVQSYSPNITQTGNEFSYHGEAYCDYSNGEENLPLEGDTTNAIIELNITLPEETTISLSGDSFVKNVTGYGFTNLDLNTSFTIYQNGHSVGGGLLNDGVVKLSAGTYTIKIEIYLKTPINPRYSYYWGGDISFKLKNVLVSTTGYKTQIGKDGIASFFGAADYMYYKKGQGFHVLIGAFGLKITNSGIYKTNNSGSSWTSM